MSVGILFAQSWMIKAIEWFLLGHLKFEHLVMGTSTSIYKHVLFMAENVSSTEIYVGTMSRVPENRMNRKSRVYHSDCQRLHVLLPLRDGIAKQLTSRL